MIVIPAVDLRGGRAVRLVQGNPGRARDYGDPVEWARRWVDAGARWLHVVDLDGALAGRPAHRDLVARLCGLGVAVQVGGGVRTVEDIAAALAAGASRVVVGTAATRLGEALGRFGPAVAVALDARRRRVALSGWTEQTPLDVVDAARRLREQGAVRFVYTDIGRDGTLSGPNLEVLAELVTCAGVPVVAAGGIATEEDLEAVERAGAEAAIVGRALYDGRLDLRRLTQRWGAGVC
ncbi:MAG: 1-(5-phosphoribosyl)-5-[(5-phosphoribosylamino)methylideneamino]imidazole-4-carboxamide isomerase [Armatimonadota bacterium]|nr:1-(5-phosphoribosyl)-5-[(5-phosphoribosylamino)methylideneamino]imidazole-4-carboxamide isomerase [Armatimonadota bacterium]MDR7401251.1 1-(5-phosphoribosyl)-5-[(5-phosphoribosylamino)methylideneamino]imidazole-4-carboxamide isomerase [Armatimonadota bacterium]MDR7402990.1 1-(5-phosphoribosyl)-5-[(5-phosphoribosylamino)methylideneamino]imidazole-4-carboxamide isomerase [Armatimonadota bacterium]MDR7437145.1 1-(5-phosphoribosyl)-5-[(5-phosphoribosylamino)methylideneamino]imidazole-4-carboxamid